MSREIAFADANLDVGFLDDPKVRALVRSTRDEAVVARCLVAYVAVMTESWEAARRVTLDDAAPLWLTTDDLLELLVRHHLLDPDGRIPARAWRARFLPAFDRLLEARYPKILGGLKSRHPEMNDVEARDETARRIAEMRRDVLADLESSTLLAELEGSTTEHTVLTGPAETELTEPPEPSERIDARERADDPWNGPDAFPSRNGRDGPNPAEAVPEEATT
jgi:hypothetical protein